MLTKHSIQTFGTEEVEIGRRGEEEDEESRNSRVSKNNMTNKNNMIETNVEKIQIEKKGLIIELSVQVSYKNKSIRSKHTE